MATSNDVTLWQYLASESKAGRLDLDPSVSNDCMKACENQINVYKECRTLLTNVSTVTGFGDFPASDALAKMFSTKAAGGQGDFDSALSNGIRVLELIRDTIKSSVDRLVEHDQSQAAAITRNTQ